MRTQHFLILAAALSLPLIFTACTDESDPKEGGYEAMQNGDHATAASAFKAALEGTDASAPDYTELRLARCEALAFVNGDESEAEFKSLCEEQSELDSKQYALIGRSLLEAEATANAARVVDMGLTAHPDDAKLTALMDKVMVAAAEAADGEDSDAMDALKGMGYLGGD